jgi:2-polyprenyl-6-methoxyphenol hydroxylase-like FAD-dependent oxidoreductase
MQNSSLSREFPPKIYKEEIDTPEELLRERKPAQWASVFAANAPSWMAEHFLKSADTIERPIKLSVVVGRCQKWYAPGLILLGDAAHPMSPIRAQGINVALRDVIIAANHLVPILLTKSSNAAIDEALARIQAEREPEIIRAQQLQAQEATQAEILRKYAFIRPLMFQVARLFRNKIRHSWIERQHDMRVGVTQVQLNV